MDPRYVLRFPGGETVVRDVSDGRWSDPEGDADVLLGGDMWALPGLVDAHAHLSRETLDFGSGEAEGAAERAWRALQAGVGLVLDKGWRDLTVVDMIDRVDEAMRPDIEAAGVIYSVAGGYVQGFCREVAPGGVADAVREGAVSGRGWVKLIGDWPRRGLGPVANFTEPELTTAVAVAEELGARVAVHTMARDVPSMAVRAGVHSIEHGLFLTEADLGALGARAGMWVPTAVRVEATIAQLGADSSGGRLLREGLANMTALLPLAVEAGVHALAGTDLAVGSHEIAKEAIRLWEMGMSAAAVIDSISGSGLRATGRPDAFQVGAPANAVFFSHDPLDEPGALSHPMRVVRLGREVG
jgi:imidazolonepropionase-like amidohydrolase